MRFWLTENGVPVRPVTGTDIRLANPGASFPSGEFTAEMMAEYGCIQVEDSPAPEYDTLTQGIREVAPVNGVQQWEVYSLNDAEKAQAVAAHNAQVIEKIAELETRQPRAVREALLGMTGSVARLQTLEDQISALRAMLR